MLWPCCVLALLVATLPGTVDATSCTPNAQIATRFLGISYDLLKADPDAAGGGGVDPGYHTRHKVIEENYEAHTTFFRHSCVTRSTTSAIYDEKSFQKKFDLDVAVSVEVSGLVANAKFALSTSFSEAKAQTTKERRMTLETQTLCNMGGARLKTELDILRASQGFQAAVCNLPTQYNQTEYILFLDEWGTGFVTQVDVGVRNLTKKTETFSSVFENIQQALGIDASASGSYGGAFVSVSGSVEMSMNRLENSQVFKSAFKGKSVKKVIGTPEYPEPIFVKVGSLHTVVTRAYFGERNPPACTSSKLAQLPAKQANLERALEEYPQARHVVISGSDGKARFPLSWPRGTYGLVKPKTSCPPGWASDGQRYWDNEDDPETITSASPDNHFDAYLRNNIQLKFCVKTVPITNVLSDIEWPAGEYCLYKYRSCPKGFTVGSIYWDDEDDEGSSNSVNGTYPDGVYDLNTRQYFCCRTDGENTVPIFLPRDTPFYLLQGSRYGCQKVQGMNVRQEYIQWDDEDGSEGYPNTNSFTGTIPHHGPSSRNWRLYFCYYWK